MSHRLIVQGRDVAVYAHGEIKPKRFVWTYWENNVISLFSEAEVRQYVVREWLSVNEVRATLIERIEAE